MDGDDRAKLVCELKLKEKSRLTASIGASHDMHAMSSLNGQLSVGIRNLFGAAEKLDFSADLGLATRKPSDGSGSGAADYLSAVQNTSNEYAMTLTKPRYEPLPGLAKGTLLLKAFKQSLDRTLSSSYKEDSVGATSMFLSHDKRHSLAYNYHLR